LQDFFGHDPHKIAALATILANADLCARGAGDFDDYDGEALIGGDKRFISTERFANHCAVICRKFGFISKAKARENGSISSASEAELNMYPTPYMREKKLMLPVTQDDIDLAAEALAWAQAFADKTERSDYEHNAMVIANSPFIEYRAMGILASIVGIYLRNKGEVKAKAEKPVSQWQGQEGDKIIVDVTVTFHTSFETAYGTSHLYKFNDASGNAFAWFSSKAIEALEEGKQVKLAGTIKKLDIYKGDKQTTLTRCKIK
jgi:hypothetical protein